MIAPNRNSLCKQARLYYYDFLFNESREVIPEFIINHVKQCQYCQEQMNRLAGVLSQAEAHESSEQGQLSPAITVMLQLHFAYMGKRVTCNTVKPFLPGLLDPALEIRIPTPITTHLDSCEQCSKDLETIRKLNLNRKQLRRLSQLFADKPGEDDIRCSQALAAISWVVLMAFHETNAEVLKHLCTCPNCRKTLYEYRESVRTDLLHYERAQEELPCEDISATDIFDYCLPYGIDPATDQYAKFREPLTSHLGGCPECLARMQQLHNTVYGIAERAESEIITIYNIDESATVQAAEEFSGLYSNFPIKVEVINRDEVKAEQSASTSNFADALTGKVSKINVKPLVKSAAIAAGVLIVVALLLYTPAAKAVTIDQIYEAIEKVKNVYISKSVPGKAEPIEEKWVSRTLNIYMSKMGKELVLSDPTNKVRKTKQLGTDSVETMLLPDDQIAETEEMITGSLGLMPFYDISKIPLDAEWRPVPNSVLKATAENTNVYDLTWVQRTYGGSATLNRWRVFINPRTNIPQRTEFYRKSPANSEYNLESVMEVEYWSNSKMQAFIKDASF